MAKISIFGWLGALALVAPAVAQQLPDAGALRQQIESSQSKTLPKAVPATPVVAPAPAPVAGEATVVARSFHFTGNTQFTAAELESVVAGFVGRPLNFAELQSAAAEVARHYRQQGWVVRTYLPRQDVSAGRITIHVVEAVLGQPEFEGTRPRGIGLEWVRDRILNQAPAGQPVKLDTIDRTLLLLDDLPGVRVAARLEPGAGDRETTLVLAVTDDALVDGAASIDNAGARSTGEVQVLGHANLNSPFGIGELFQAQAMVSRGAQFLRLAYNQPLGLSEWRVGANASQLRYTLTEEEFAALDARGSSSGIGIDAMYPLFRSRPRNLFAVLGAERMSFNNEVAGTTTTDYTVDRLSIGLLGNQLDGFWFGGALRGQATAVFGQVDLAGSPNEAADAATTQIAGDFFKLRFAGQNERALSGRNLLLLSVSGQIANKNLESSERFYLGGPNGVRAYPVSEGGGSEGLLTTVELQRQLPERLTAAGFVDWGMVRVNRNNDFPGASPTNRYALSGLGASIAWQGPWRLTAKLTWAHRIGDNPNAGSSGNDQDGSLVENRFWLSAQMPFEFQ